MPYGITQCYLPPDRGDIPALYPKILEASVRRRPLEVQSSLVICDDNDDDDVLCDVLNSSAGDNDI